VVKRFLIRSLEIQSSNPSANVSYALHPGLAPGSFFPGTMATVRPFLTASWIDLVVLNFDVDPSALTHRVPPGLELDLFEGRAMVSLVAFKFVDTRVRGIAIPGHTDFDEVNLRFYVRRVMGSEIRRGTTFVREFVPKPAITFVAKTLYGEPYQTVKLSHSEAMDRDGRRLTYRWGKSGLENHVSVTVGGEPGPMIPGSEEEFTLEQYWGYTARGNRTDEYRVAHPAWRIWSPESVDLNLDVEACYGREWVEALSKPCAKAMVAEGSAIEVYPGTRLPG
jgi:uncharacterized protein